MSDTIVGVEGLSPQETSEVFHVLVTRHPDTSGWTHEQTLAELRKIRAEVFGR